MTAITATVRGETGAHGVLLVMRSLLCLVGGTNIGQWFIEGFSINVNCRSKYINLLIYKYKAESSGDPYKYILPYLFFPFPF